jgi:hypothetical protein
VFELTGLKTKIFKVFILHNDRFYSQLENIYENDSVSIRKKNHDAKLESCWA